MKIAHWTMFNHSGMYRVAEAFAKTECSQGLDSWLVNYADPSGYADVVDADVHVVHTHFPDAARPMLTKPLKLIWIAHGTPEHVFQMSVEAGLNRGYGAEDSWQLCQYWMQHSDAIVTFWPRHQKIWKSLCDKNTPVHCIPMGVDRTFWKPVESAGHFLGSPSLFSAENCHYSKWPLDLFLAWPWVWPEIPEAFLHVFYLPTDQHKWFVPLMNRNGCSFKTLTSNSILSPVDLRNAFVSNDYYVGLVRYGDFNRINLEANASGIKTITYAGNEYADFWVTEGDQREIARQLAAILKGDVKPRKKAPVPDVTDMVKAMRGIYEMVL